MTTFLAVLGVLAALGSAGFTLGRMAQSLGTPFVQLAAFTPLGLAGWPVAGVLLLLGRVWWVAGLALVLTAVHATWFLAPSLRARAAGPEDGLIDGPTLRVFTQNCLLGRANAAQIVDLVSTERIDVLLLEELTAGLAARLHAVGIDAVLPHHDTHPRPGGMGTGIWSRHPLHALGLVAPDAPAMPQVVVEVPGAGPVSVTAVHTHPPLARVVGRWRRQMATLAEVLTHRRSPVPHRAGPSAPPLPQIVAGDFNATRDHREFRALLAATGLVDTVEATRTAGPAATWPADRVCPVLTRLDHILVSPQSITVESHTVVAVEDSDHRGLIATLRLRPA